MDEFLDSLYPDLTLEDDDLLDQLYPELTLETDDIIMSISVKKDYSQIEDLDMRKKEFIKDLHDFINEFDETPESLEFMRYFDDQYLESIFSNTFFTFTFVSKHPVFSSKTPCGQKSDNNIII